MVYLKPAGVISPKASWTLMRVIYDDGEGETALALGTWNGDVRLGIRWNGRDDNPIGNPQSRGLPTWFILPSWLHRIVLETVKDYDHVDQAAVRAARTLLAE